MERILDDEFPYADGILDGKTALVCGASKGIGRATALMPVSYTHLRAHET